MTDSLPPPDAETAAPDETPQTVRAKRKAQREWRADRRQACFDLMSAGYTYAEVAKALKVSVRAVRREVTRAIDERRLDAPERYVHLQVNRLTRALRSADDLVERGDMRAVAPFIKLVEALDRYHGLDARYRREPRLPLQSDAPKRLALGAPAETLAKVTELNTQAPEKLWS